MELYTRTLGDWLEHWAEATPDKEYIVYSDRNLRFTWRQFNERVDNMAKGLLAIGVKRNTHVGIWAGNVPDWLTFLYACAKIGAVAVTVNTNYKQTELEYLKHQINPHFFMNTLNNIHALIDVDTEKAKESVIELSKIMRYILYDSSQPIISLQKEITLLNNYIALMRIRYTDSIDISVNIADNLPDVQIPPLLFISFIENAFKHGISYQHPSFVHIMLETREKELSFYIVNSNFSDTHNPSGIGLENVTKRLQLLYGDKYILETRAEENSFSVNLIIPIES